MDRSLRSSLAELEVARDGLNPYEEDELIYLWKQTFADNISGEEIQVINIHMPKYAETNSLQDVRDYLDGIFDTQLFRSLCVDIARFLPSRYVPDKRTMQANRDRFERKEEEVDDETRDDEELGSNEEEPPWTHSSCLRSRTLGSSYATRKKTPAVTSPLMGSTQPAISSGCCTIPPKKLL